MPYLNTQGIIIKTSPFRRYLDNKPRTTRYLTLRIKEVGTIVERVTRGRTGPGWSEILKNLDLGTKNLDILILSQSVNA